jgi:ABC-type uncharacterized transport system substrate-binding protein
LLRAAIEAVKHRWTFNEDFRRSNFDEFDINQNGTLDADELSAFQQLSLETLKRLDSFTVIWLGAERIPLKEPVLVSFDMQDSKPIYKFSVALSKPVPLTGAGASIEVYDPTYFSAFDFRSDHAVSVESKDGADCSAALVSPPRDSAQMRDYRAFISAFGPLSAKLVTPRSINLTCQSSPSGRSNTREGVGQ